MGRSQGRRSRHGAALRCYLAFLQANICENAPKQSVTANSKLPEKSQKEHYLLKNAPSEGNRANVRTGRQTAGEPALRSSSWSVRPPLYVRGGPPPPAALPPHFHYLPAHLTPRCATHPGLSSSSCSSPPPEVRPVVITSQSFQGRPTASSKQLLPLTILQQ